MHDSWTHIGMEKCGAGARPYNYIPVLLLCVMVTSSICLPITSVDTLLRLLDRYSSASRLQVQPSHDRSCARVCSRPADPCAMTAPPIGYVAPAAPSTSGSDTDIQSEDRGPRSARPERRSAGTRADKRPSPECERSTCAPAIPDYPSGWRPS